MLKKNLVFLLILLLGLSLRLIIINQSLWLDEAIGALAVRDFTFGEIITKFIMFDNHPPLYYLILKVWTDLFGYSEISLRMPSIFVGLGTIIVIYKIHSISNFEKKSQANSFFLAFLLATSQLHVYFSQEARMYIFTGLFAAFSTYFFLKTIISNRISDWVGFGIFSVLLAFSDYLPIVLFPAFFVFGLVKKQKAVWWRHFFVSFLPLLILAVMWAPTFLTQSERGRWLLMTVPNWFEVAGGANFKQIVLVWMKFVFGRISLVWKNMYYLLVGLASIPFLILFFKSLNRRIFANFYFYWLSIPLSLGFILSFIVPAFNYFRFIFILPAFYGLAVKGLSNISNLQYKKLIMSALVAFNILSLTLYYFVPANHREDWKGAMSLVESNIKAGEVVLFSYPEPFAPYEWYENNDFSHGATDSILATSESVNITKDLLGDRRGVYYFEYLSGLSDPQMLVQKTILANDFRQVSVYNFNGVGLVYYYQK